MAAFSNLFGLILATYLVGISADTDTVGCAKDFLSYNNNCYYISKRATDWKSAQGECNNLDASLLRLESQDEATWVKTTLANYPSSGYWTALNDIPKVTGKTLGTNVWKWGMSEYANMSLVQWNQSPANDGQSNCAGVNIQGTLADIQCKAKQGFMCNKNSADGSCSLGWIPRSTVNKCYWVGNTSDPSQLMTWADAKNFCETNSTGAKLFVINDQNDYNFLTNEIPYMTQTTRTHWIGYTRTNGNWGWYDGTTVNTNFIKWQSEPDNLGGLENCGVMRMSGKFNTRDCSSKARYICKAPSYNYAPSDNIGCGPWIRAGHSCYDFHYSTKLSWTDARNYCLQRAGDLMKMDSYDKQDWLSQQMLDSTNDRIYWIGMNDQATEGTYVWTDGSAVNQTYIRWNQEPNDYKGTEDCAVVYNNGQYNDVQCTGKAAAICELDNVASCPTSPPGWIYNAATHNCYLFTPTTNASALYQQGEATNYCGSFAPSTGHQGALLSVNDATEKTYIKQQLALQPENPAGYYTSLNDKVSEGFWTFTDGFYDSSLVDWTGEPSQAPNDDCAFVNWGGALHERNCKWKLGFICERLATGYTGGSMTVTSVYTSLICICLYLAVLLK